MTACVKNHSKRVALAISASLVGALSLGAAPVAAMADTTSGIDLQSVDPGVAVSGGSLAYAYDNTGCIIDDLESLEFEAGGQALYPVPSKVLPKNADNAVSIIRSDRVDYYRDIDGDGKLDRADASIGSLWYAYKWNAGEVFKTGDYLCVVTIKYGNYAGSQITIPFKVVAKSLKGATIYNKADGGSIFTYSKTGQDFGFKLDGAEADVNVWYWDYQKNTYVQKNEVVAAGDYAAVLTGKGAYEGSMEVVNFTIDKLDLSTAVVTVKDTDVNGAPKSVYIDGVEYTGAEVKIKQNEPGWHNGTYSVTVTPADGNMTGSATASFNKVDHLITDWWFKVNNKAVDGELKIYTNDYSTMVNADDFTIGYQDTYPASEIKPSIKVYAEDGTETDLKTMNEVAGDYTLVLRVDAEASGWEYGSNPVTVKVQTRKGKIDANASLTYKFDGDVVKGAVFPEYTGSDMLERLGVVLELADGAVLTQGEDYEVTVTNGKGEIVDQVVDAGTYNVAVTSKAYEITGQKLWSTIDIVVKPVELGDVKLGSDDMKSFGDDGSFIPYTGADHDYYFYTMDGKKEVRVPDGVLEADHFEYTYIDEDGDNQTVDADAINGIGTYKAIMVLADGVTNYRLAWWNNDSSTIEVKSAKVFSDVPATYWGAESVYDAAEQGYIKGVAGTSLFKPESAITRADAVVVIFRMAGADQYYINHPEMSTQDLGGYMTKYSDVDEGAYYAKAVAWATKVDIAHGDAGSDTFRPEDTITREEFAALLKNYAAAMGDYVAPGDDALAEFPDASEVSPWMTEAVAWAAENGVMGNKGVLNPTNDVKRAEVAAMAVNYQPKALSQDDVLVDVPVLK